MGTVSANGGLAVRYSIVIPIYNDGYLAAACCDELTRVFTTLLEPGATLEDTVEILFINDGSPNDSLVDLLVLARQHAHVTVIDLSRNFGQHQAIACGFQAAKGDIVIRLNVDMQDPPAELPKLIETLVSEDADLVVGQYTNRQSPWFDRLTSALYFRAFRFLTGLDVPRHTSPMRVMSRRFIDAYNRLTEKSRFPQGLDAWLGFRQRTVPIAHQPRIDRKSSYTFRKRVALALSGILYFSDRPIKLVAVLGLMLAGIGVLLGIVIIVTKLMGQDYLSGYASLASIGLLTFGVQLACLGVIGLYIGKIVREVQNRPLYLVREIYGKGAQHGA